MIRNETWYRSSDLEKIGILQGKKKITPASAKSWRVECQVVEERVAKAIAQINGDVESEKELKLALKAKRDFSKSLDDLAARFDDKDPQIKSDDVHFERAFAKSWEIDECGMRHIPNYNPDDPWDLYLASKHLAREDSEKMNTMEEKKEKEEKKQKMKEKKKKKQEEKKGFTIEFDL